MGLFRHLLAPDPIIFDNLVFAVVDQLIDNVIDLEAYTQGPVPHDNLFSTVEIAHEACLNKCYQGVIIRWFFKNFSHLPL